MPRILAIDWDRLEARAVLVHAGPTGTTVVGAWAESLSSDEGAPPTVEQVGAQLAAALAGKVSSSVVTHVGVGRDHVQMKLLALPPAPAEELPELVRFQAEREFTALGDDAALDFIPLVGDATTPNQVLAAALASRGLEDVNEICRAIDVEPDRITLRAAAAASFVARSFPPGGSDVTLVAHRLSDEADLTVLDGAQVVLVRTVRLPSASEEASWQRVLAAEIRRTVAAVRQQSGDRPVAKVMLCGTASDAASAAALADEIGLAVEVFDVASHAPAGLSGTGVADESQGRLAAVLGMALGEADRRAPVVDFLHVRQRTAQRRFTRIHALAVAAAAVAVLAIGVHLWRQLAAPRWELQAVNAELAGLDSQRRQYKQVTNQAAAVDRWLATDVNWLDQLDRLSRQWRPELLNSEEFPVSDDVVVTALTATPPAEAGARGGFFNLNAVAKTSAAVAPLEARLRDNEHRVTTGGGNLDRTITGYAWSFDLRMDVPPTAGSEEAAP